MGETPGFPRAGHIVTGSLGCGSYRGGTSQSHAFFLCVPNSGTGAHAGITGAGGLVIDADGTHHIWLDY